MAARNDRLEGTLASWNADRGFGFITPTGGGQQVFAHVRAFPQGSPTPVVGSELSYEVEKTPDGKTRARFVRVAGSAPVQTYGRVRSNLLSYLPIALFVAIYIVVQVLWHPPYWVLFVYLGTSLLCILIYSVDKSAAALGRWRVSESALLLLGLAGGWPGAILAQRLLHHKTKKRSFQSAFAGSIVVNILAFVILSSPFVASLFRISSSN
jgi:uncharacterized membrane protein YsdA (DUF1294 family)/cold shock CspA family protein